MKRILKHVKDYKFQFIIPTISMIILVSLAMYTPYVMKLIIDKVVIGREYDLLSKLLITLFAITVGRSVFGFIQEYLFDMVGAKIAQDIRRDLFTHIQNLSFGFFDKTNTGEIMSRTTGDIGNIWMVTGFVAVFFTQQMLYFALGAIMIFSIEWRLAFVTMAFMPIIAYLAIKLDKEVGKVYEEISDQDATLNTTAQENIAGVRLVKAFGREKHEVSKFLKENKQKYKLNVKRVKTWVKYQPVIELITNVVIIIVVCLGGAMVISNELTLGNLVAFYGYVMLMIWPMRMLGFLINNLAQCNASAKKIFKIMDIKSNITSPKNPLFPKEEVGNIVFDRVTLKYDNNIVLNDVSFEVKAGKTIAIMGTTGSGKSSIANLIARYYDCSEGKILVDEIDVKQRKLLNLRSQISVVMQDTFLFSDTISSNIKFGHNEINDEEMINVSKLAKVHGFVEAMSDKYDTVIGERGVGLSGGQKQRIAIARALLKEANILVLDDATSSLDTETEFDIQKGLVKLKTLTKVIIAHRISAVKDADEIILLENGEITERGNHKSLLEKQGRYYHIFKEQYGDIDAPKNEVILCQ
ncbi:MAG: ABC transporter ATP-binding protein [Alkaliphilus sp.]